MSAMVGRNNNHKNYYFQQHNITEFLTLSMNWSVTVIDKIKLIKASKLKQKLWAAAAAAAAAAWSKHEHTGCPVVLTRLVRVSDWERIMEQAVCLLCTINGEMITFCFLATLQSFLIVRFVAELFFRCRASL